MWDLPRAFGTLAEAGFDAFELMVTRDPLTQSPDTPARLAEREGLEIVAVHAPMLLLTRRVWGPNFMPIVERSVDLAIELGAPVVIVHPPYLWELRYQSWLLGRLNRYAAERGVTIAVENMFNLWVRDRPIRGYRWVTPADLHRFSHVTLDTSHCGVDGYDILKATEEVGRRLAHVHLSDNHGEHRDSHALPGTGLLPLEPFVRQLGEQGYSGAISLELDLREAAADPRDVVEALRHSREFCEAQLEEATPPRKP